MRVTVDDMRHAVKGHEVDPHCWGSSDGRDACMLLDEHDGDCEYVATDRILITLSDAGFQLTVRVAEEQEPA